MVKNVIVSLKVQGESTRRDIQLPIDVPTGEIANILAKALLGNAYVGDGSVKYYLKSDPPGRFLDGKETLFDAGVWDGFNMMLMFG